MSCIARVRKTGHKLVVFASHPERYNSVIAAFDNVMLVFEKKHAALWWCFGLMSPLSLLRVRGGCVDAAVDVSVSPFIFSGVFFFFTNSLHSSASTAVDRRSHRVARLAFGARFS